jgi:hypothetical protein
MHYSICTICKVDNTTVCKTLFTHPVISPDAMHIGESFFPDRCLPLDQYPGTKHLPSSRCLPECVVIIIGFILQAGYFGKWKNSLGLDLD